jgi:hypothetical protein
VAFETYNSADSLIRITMYGLGGNDSHSYTMVLYPSSSEEADAAAYIMAVGYDGTREKIYAKTNQQKSLEANKFYTITSMGKGNALSCGANTSINQSGTISWSLERATLSSSFNFVWYLEKRDGKTYLYNPQSNSYFTGKDGAKTTELCDKASAPYFEAACVDETKGTYTFSLNGGGQYINSYNATETGLYGGGAGDANNIWKVEEISTFTFSIGNSGHYLACSPVALQLPEGLEAFVVGEHKVLNYEGTDYTYLALDKVEGNIIPARMPVVLAGTPGKYNLTLVAEDNTQPTTPNLLKGTTLKLTGISRATLLYNATLTSDAGTTATVKLATTNTTVPINRAYLLTSDVDGATQVYLQSRDFVTGIGNVESTTASPIFYSPNGTRANKLQSGRIYITSEGKTILVK